MKSSKIGIFQRLLFIEPSSFHDFYNKDVVTHRIMGCFIYLTCVYVDYSWKVVLYTRDGMSFSPAVLFIIPQ